MEPTTYWAYDFVFGRTIEEMHALLNEAGPWVWTLRDSAWYGDYLAAYPAEWARVRIHEYPQITEGGVFRGLRGKGYSVLLDIRPPGTATFEEVDPVFRELLDRIGATDLVPIPPYD